MRCKLSDIFRHLRDGFAAASPAGRAQAPHGLKAQVFGLIAAVLITACTPENGGDRDGAHDNTHVEAITNRIAVPEAVRRNLGITFVAVERRHVASTIRVPGRFELLPTARREYHATLDGRVELLVTQYQPVEVGTPLYRIDSPQWRQMQQQLSETTSAIRQTAQRLEGIEAKARAIAHHADSLDEQQRIWTRRVEQIEELIAAGGGAASELAEARAQLAATRTQLAEVEEERADAALERSQLESQLAAYLESMPLLAADALGRDVPGSASRTDLALTPAAAMLAIPVEELRRNVGSAAEAVPLWRTLDVIEFKATQPGIVQSLAVTNGSWAAPASLVLTTIDPGALRFRAAGLQADLAQLRNDMSVAIVPPRRGTQALASAIEGRLLIGLEADALERKVDLIAELDRASPPAWARPGVAAEMEIALDQTSEPELAIPLAAVISDGLEKVIFRRNPRNPDEVIRIEADLGIDDGRWVVVRSGLTDGDEVVHHGVYELMLASGATEKAKGGHFHADGTFHEGEH